MPAIDLLHRSEALLLDFDGPVCTVFSDIDLRAEVSGMFARLEVSPPATSDGTSEGDPLQFLRWIAREHPSRLPSAEEMVIALEVRGASAAEPTAGILGVLADCDSRGQPVAIVSNNSDECIRAFVRRQGGAFEGIPVVGRVPCRPDLMKPDPDPLWRGCAILGRSAASSVLLGDSVSDIEAARNADVWTIAFVNKERKELPLIHAHPDAIIHRLEELLV